MVRDLICGVLVVCGGCAMGAYAPQGTAEVDAPRPPTIERSNDGLDVLSPEMSRTGDASVMAVRRVRSSSDDMMLTAETSSSGARPPRAQYDLERGVDAVSEVAPPPEPTRYAQASPTSITPPTAIDTRTLPSSMLIYTASFVVAVLDVAQQQTRLIARAREMGGFLAEQSGTVVRVRVPAARFDEYLLVVAELGQVRDRRVTVTDVGEEYRDVAIRIQNLEAVRHRFEQMLTQANNVETALAIQRELERVTTELEVLKGRQRYLADQVALSTVTVSFQPLATAYPDSQIRLPFTWLRQLGLRNLLTLDER